MVSCLDKIGKEDKQGGPYYNGFDRVRMETVYKDTIQNEKRLGQFSPYFNMNFMQRTASIPGGPTMRVRHNRMEFVDGKVQEKTPKQRMKPAKLDAFAEEAVEHLKRGPADKFVVPATTQQEIGWLLSSPMHAARAIQKGGGDVRAPMLVRNYYDEKKRERDLKSREPDPDALKPMLSRLNNRPRSAPPKSEMHKYAENWYNTMGRVSPFAKTQPQSRGG
jgi:hypothetical protein